MNRGGLSHRLRRAGCWLVERFAEGSSQAAIAAAIVNFSLTPPPASWICIALGFGQVLLPDGSLRRTRGRRRARRFAHAGTRKPAAVRRPHRKGE